MPIHVSPGVYFREIDLSLYAPKLSTCIFGNVGTATKGPVNTLIYISSHPQFIREFGNPSPNHLATLAHLQFLSKGTQSYFIRVTDGTEAKATVDLPVAEGPAVMTGTELSPFVITEQGYGTITGEEASTFSVVASTVGTFTGGNASGNLAALQAIANGNLGITLTDRSGAATGPVNVSAIDLTTALTLADVAALVETAVQAGDPAFTEITCTYVGSNFVLSTGPWDTGQNATVTPTNGGGGTDLFLAANLDFASSALGAVPGGNGNDLIGFAVDGGADQFVRLSAGGFQTAAQVRDDINSGTVGITADVYSSGGSDYVRVRTNTVGSTGDIVLVNPDVNYTDNYTQGILAVFGTNFWDPIPALVAGDDGEVLLDIWVNGFGSYKSGSAADNLGNFTAVGNARVTVNIDALDGAGVETADMDFTGAADMNAVATIIETEINTASAGTVVVTWSEPYFYVVSQGTKGAGSTVALSDATTPGKVNLLQASLFPVGAATAGAAMQSLTLPSGTVTISALVSALGTLTGAQATNYRNYLRLTTTAVGPAAHMMVEVSSTCEAALGLTNSEFFGTPTGAATLRIFAQTPGTAGDNLSVTTVESYQKQQHDQWISDHPGDPETDSEWYAYRDAFRIDVYDSGYKVASFDNLVIDDVDHADYVERIIGIETDRYDPTRVIVVEDLMLGQAPIIDQTYELSGGSDGDTALASADFIGTVLPDGTKSGMQILSDAETVDVNIIAVPGVSDPATITAMTSLCETRGDAMCIIDPPFGLNGPQDITNWSNRQGAHSPGQPINSSYAALYWPWVLVYDAYNDQEVWTPPCGHAAGVYAYTDFVSYPWFAPAGFNRAHLIVGLDLEMNSNQGDRDLMYGYPNIVNPIVNFFPDGITIWGQRTCQRRPSATDRVNVRRMLLYARKVVATVIRYLVFEPSDIITWKRFVLLCNPIFEFIKRTRGLYDFRVICDETTNPPDLIDQNTMNGRIYMKPTKTAEAIEVDFVLLTTGADFDEVEY